MVDQAALGRYSDPLKEGLVCIENSFNMEKQHKNTTKSEEINTL